MASCLKQFLVFGIAALGVSVVALAATSIETIPNGRGLRVIGQPTGSALGYSETSPMGDLNGDGRADLVLAAPAAARPGAANVGSAYIFFGTVALGSSLNVSAANTTIIGSALLASTNLGRFVTGVGDVNNDNVDDFLMGTSRGAIGQGAAYLIFGGASLPAQIDVSNLGAAGVLLTGEFSSDNFGVFASSEGGDVNGDGISDFLVGAPSVDGQRGRSYLVFGRSTWPQTLNMAGQPVTSVVQLTGANQGDLFGVANHIGADINNDGVPELFINANAFDLAANSDEGRSYVIFGRTAANPWPATFAMSAINGSNGFSVTGTVPVGGFGAPILSMGDVNGDGVGDFAMGQALAAGSVALLYGKANWDANISVSVLDGVIGTRFTGEANNDAAGAYLAAPGDLNGDGFAEIIISAPGADPLARTNAGKVYVIRGRAANFAATEPLSAVEAAIAGEVFIGPSANFGAGPISGLGKLNNGDAAPDFLIASETAAGDVYVVLRQAGVSDGFQNGFEGN